jgi:hypothetical protein
MFALIAICIGLWVKSVRAQAPVQIGANAPLPVFITNPVGPESLPTGFAPNTRWRFTTWTLPSVLTWTATVNQTSGPWANLTIEAEGVTSTRWYYVPNMPGSWEPQ